MCLVKTLVLNRIEDNVCSGPKVFGYFLFPRQSNVAFASAVLQLSFAKNCVHKIFSRYYLEQIAFCKERKCVVFSECFTILGTLE